MSHNNAYDHMVVVTDAAQNYWRLDQSADQLVDLAHTATNTNTSPGSGSNYDLLPATNNNYSTRFVASNPDYITFNDLHFAGYDGNGFGGKTAFSIECWIRPASDQSATDVIGICGQQGVAGIYLAYGVPTGYFTTDGSTKNTISGSSAVSSGSVYHLVYTFEWVLGDPNLRETHLYINGTDNYYFFADGSMPYAGSNNFTIGAWDPTDLNFDGYISNVAIYDHALTSTKVSNHHGYSG